ncbi:Signal transduction histidine kinase CheA [Sandaracinus amylolyticus]|uniref:histidine kinase n=1 Tax=Sandaracinus amylolyticus TaxID=927083 RepID=A0A0F6YI66_9BACT|nr:Signal transduction histidine kinase CheA [Sandaracinus amylolyticus]
MQDRDLVRAFWDAASDRISEATDLWIALEQGDAGASRSLKRLLHTMKGEAHMLGLADCGHLLQSMEGVVERASKAMSEGAGDAILTALDAISAMAASEGALEIDLDEIFARLAAASAAAATSTETHADATHTEVEARAEHVEHARPSLDPARLAPLVHEARRLHREHSLLHPALREVRRMLRALLSEIDPQLPPEALAERIVKTLGYGAEIERRMGDLAAQWSTHEFALEMALEQLEDTVRSAAMVSVAALKSQVHRAARSTAHALGKRVELLVSGDAYVDASVERSLGPALLHLVRNAVDHGIESELARTAAGKSPVGRIEITIHQTDSSVQVIVEDDGGGVDLERMRTRLRHEGDDSELLQRIFEQGVTTRDEVTDISGRGVGLDVVAREVAAVGGSVRVESERGRGTRFEIVLPTMLRADIVVPIECRGTRLAIPVREVLAVERMGEPVRASDGWRLARGPANAADLVPLFDLGALFGAAEPPRAGDVAVITHHRTGVFALRVDGYDNPRPMAFERIDELAVRSDVVRGVAPAPDGGVYFLLDADATHATLRGRVATSAARPSTSPRRAVPHVLVVEDAPVARELLLGILRSFGLKVSDASDGKQGLLLARTERPDLILTDVEMPFLGGLEMIAELRGDPALREVPVIVLTTRSEPAVRDRARALGVRGFLSKQRFVETELRQVIDECLAR